MTKTTTVTLTEFLLARIAEDEAVARGAYRDSVDDDGVCHEDWTDATTAVMWGDTAAISGLEADYLANHIARHDPARALAEIEAKRRIVGLHSGTWVSPENWWACNQCGTPGEYDVGWPCPTLRALASVHADHPDYDASWA